MSFWRQPIGLVERKAPLLFHPLYDLEDGILAAVFGVVPGTGGIEPIIDDHSDAGNEIAKVHSHAVSFTKLTMKLAPGSSLS